ncbi:MAG: hypothetical protein PHE67_11910 [Campylobacterales bacterium]|nr:hypothetical protein [Campylobacterales bacterium]
MRDLLHISSVKQEKAMFMAIFHVVVAPFVVLWLVYLVEAQWSAAAALAYVVFLSGLNFFRLRYSRSSYDRLKSAYYFECLKYFMSFMLAIALGFLLLIVGG